MDISGVDVDCLSDEEILDLCSDIIDCNNDEISVLKGVNVNNLSDDKVQKIYDDVMYNVKDSVYINAVPLSDKQVLDNNYNIVDMDENEVVLLLNGHNINFDNLSDDEILALYNNTLDTEDNFLIATNGTGFYDLYFNRYISGGYAQISLSGAQTPNRYWVNDYCYISASTNSYKGYLVYENIVSFYTNGAQCYMVSVADHGYDATYNTCYFRVAFRCFYGTAYMDTYCSVKSYNCK